MRKGVRRALAVAAAVALLGALVFVAWGMTPLGPAEDALTALQSNADVTVREDGDGLVFTPTSRPPVTGLILYPGGHVDHRSYAPIARTIAGRGYLVAVVRMPLSLAVFGIDRAEGVIAAHPSVAHWVVGGHSLGGSMAASYAARHADRVQGVAFWAAYPAAGDDLSATGLKGLSVYGSNDLVLNRDNLNATLGLLPPGTIVRVIEGGNHAQFGNYGPQPGDGAAAISAADQQAQTADLTVDLLRAVEAA